MNRVIGTEGNVTFADFTPDDEVTAGIGAAVEMLYQDELVTMCRLYIQIGDECVVQHVTVEHD